MSTTEKDASRSSLSSPSSRSLISSIGLVLFASQWPFILGLIFGGCCSNAYFLELGTAAVPSAGTLITFAQFLATALTCTPSQLEWSSASTTTPGRPASKSWFPRLKKPKVPVSRWSVQVLLYLSTSLLNNAAFAYDIPMSVHIVFRSGGLVINMILGWAIEGRRYNFMQVTSVFIVTVGVIAATLFAQAPSASPSSSSSSSTISPTYIFGVSLLFLALILSGLMGLYQERTFRTYGRDNWQEALFYAHTLSLPIFLTRWRKLGEEIRLADSTPPIWLGWLSSERVSAAVGEGLRLRGSKMDDASAGLIGLGASTLDLGAGCVLRRIAQSNLFYSSGNRYSSCPSNVGFTSLVDSAWTPSSSAVSPTAAPWHIGWSTQPKGNFPTSLSMTVPSFWPVLLLNVLTQLLCINGVNRLTSQVTSLTVTLVLVLRKATSLAISVVWVGGRTGNWGLWSGAGAVLLGTIGYTLASSSSSPKKKEAATEEKKRVGDGVVSSSKEGTSGGPTRRRTVRKD
ncbi:hypothetical protein CF327_g5301 [Tilletia walkeri]|nr:hypothetical protein CF327_g5301 [Tilletia walkeri]